MKPGLFVLSFLLLHVAEAQTSKTGEPIFTKEQKWLLDKTGAFLKGSNNNTAAALFLKGYTNVILSDRFCKVKASPTATIDLEGERVTEKITLLTWHVTGETEDAQYIIERRFNNAIGSFDSIATINGAGAATDYRTYRFTDLNDFPGRTFYRLRKLDKNLTGKQIVTVKGYNNSVAIYPNPAPSSRVYVKLNTFKTDNNTSLLILDAKGSIVYQQQRAFSNGRSDLYLDHIKLAKGTYHVKVVNSFNAGGAILIVQ